MSDIRVGDWVQTSRWDYIGRVTAIHPECPESDGWMAGQQIPVTDKQRLEPWVSILVHGGGSVVAPIDSITVLTEHPDVLDNSWSDIRFDPIDLLIDEAARWLQERGEIMSRESMSSRWAQDIQDSDDWGCEIARSLAAQAKKGVTA